LSGYQKFGTALLILAALGSGIALEKFLLSKSTGDKEGPKILYWVAPMDANFRRDGPGKSPMGMDLVPVYEGEEPSGDPTEVVLSPEEINTIGVRTALSRLEPIAQRIDTVGFVAYNDHATSHIHMRVEGWVETLHVRAVGERVRKGDVLFEIYAPEINIAAHELSRALQRGHKVEARISRQKLRNFGMEDRQIKELSRSRNAARTIKVYAPQDGIVVGLNAADGMYLDPDIQAMTLTDLSSVWVIVDVFERDIGRLSEVKRAVARFDALPGQNFEGEIDYIYPELDPTTRTVPVRLRFDNRENRLRPNMFGTVSLLPKTTRAAMTVPSEAVIRTGRAERVMVKIGDGRFKPRLVTTGLRDGFAEDSRTEILQGLRLGEEIVTSAQFLLDSESALKAGFLRMAPTRSDPAAGSGVLVSLDPEGRQAVIRHDILDSLDWPAMETRFGLHADVDPMILKTLNPGDAVAFSALRGSDGVLALLRLGADDGIAASGTGIVHAVTPDGKLTLTHDPIPALGWPAMKMDLAVQGFDPATVPLETPGRFDLAKGDGGLFLIVAWHETSGKAMADSKSAPSGPMASKPALDPMSSEAMAPQSEIKSENASSENPSSENSGPMQVTGTINAIDHENRMANVTHGPLTEIGMPGMTMDFPLAEALALESLPIGQEGTLLLRKGAGFSLTLMGFEEGEAP